MANLPIAHIGILVSDVETARRHWANALGAPFSPVVRYRSAAWSGLADPIPHANDLRQIIYSGVNPSIEIQEFVNNGSHAATRGEGGHHLSFPPVSDNNARRRELADLGVLMAGGANHDGRWIIQFSDPRPLNNVSTEWVEESPGHLDLMDDGSPAKPLFSGERKLSGITEFGVKVANLATAIERWSMVTGYQFELDNDGTAVTRGVAPAVRLVEAGEQDVREGLFYAVVETPSVEATLERLRRDGVPLMTDLDSRTDHVHVDPAYLNGFSVRFVAEGASQV
jgi:catechol 2,3-dioxygenase-like lactoylglutathione lyase family enzyme